MPRIFEKIYTAATAAVEKEGGLKKTVFDWAIGVGRRSARARARGQASPGFFLRRQYEIADKQVLSKIRDLFGGRIKLAVTRRRPDQPGDPALLRRGRRAHRSRAGA